MVMIEKAKRLHYIWSWRIRYWWLDTRSGEYARWASFYLGLLVVIIQIVRVYVAALQPPVPAQPTKAVYWWVIQLIIAIIAAAIAYSMRPKAQTPTPQSGEAPTTNDGQTVKHHFGTCWVDDEFLLAWKQMGTIPVKTKGGKK
ncbi:hypothetical protein [Stenotrophomonas forensis]|uniref:hypothetical protein n=1 Tax=Stenotrophomonas forensis TaxID=2871169 RepID=UPI0018D32260|nr:hypothetical protein [Stenotrophomonas maltophilia]MBH1501867.1 hypothetical protein [Stenotrophomonas maltophilia]MBH1785060.1 hypothetical protein [Stenotrophomonas maltophilia]